MNVYAIWLKGSTEPWHVAAHDPEGAIGIFRSERVTLSNSPIVKTELVVEGLIIQERPR